MVKLTLVMVVMVSKCSAQVEWKVEDKVSGYGEDLQLFCKAGNYSTNTRQVKRWFGGPEQKMLVLNGAPNEEDATKYGMLFKSEGFVLIIRNVTKEDLNVTYECTYGFQTSGKIVLKREDVFKVIQIVKPSNRESKETNYATIYGLLILIVIMLAVVIILLYLLHRKGRLRVLKNRCEGRAKCFCIGEYHQAKTTDVAQTSGPR